jgi:hypothetical protein
VEIHTVVAALGTTTVAAAATTAAAAAAVLRDVSGVPARRLKPGPAPPSKQLYPLQVSSSVSFANTCERLS